MINNEIITHFKGRRKKLKEKLTKVWQLCETKQLAEMFEKYMKSIGVRKYDGRRKDNNNTYMTDGNCTRWNRVQCYYHKDSVKYSKENLVIVLRKRAGNYFIIERKGIRAFEVDHSGISCYEENLLNEIMKEHKPLFDSLIKLVG